MRSFSSLSIVFLLGSILFLICSGIPSYSQDKHGDRILRGSFLEMRSYNREFGRYFGFGGFGGVLEKNGPVLKSTSVSFGYYPTKRGTFPASSINSRQHYIVDKRFSGIGGDFKYQFLAFLNGKVDESGIFIRWASSLHFASFELEYLDKEDIPPKVELYPEGRKDKLSFYFELEPGYSIDLGITSGFVGLQAGIPVFTTFYRSIELADGGNYSYDFVDMDNHQLVGMPFYWGIRGGITL